jgi:hypothetical protein
MKMMPGQTPYTPEQEIKLNHMLKDACAAQEEFGEDELEQHAAKQLSDKISRLPREKCVELLTDICIQCYDHETVDVLREAVEVNVNEGNIHRDRMD